MDSTFVTVLSFSIIIFISRVKGYNFRLHSFQGPIPKFCKIFNINSIIAKSFYRERLNRKTLIIAMEEISLPIKICYSCTIYQLSSCTVYYCCILSLSLFTFRSYLSYYISWLAFGIDHKDLVLLCILSNPLRYGAAFTI